MKAVFVTGTDTDVGKTVACAWLCHHWKAAYWKPIQSGLADGTDSLSIEQLCSAEVYPETYRLTEPLSPHASAKLDNVTIDLDRFKLPSGAQRLVVEGAGGLLVPLNDTKLVADLITTLRLACIVVARSGLGTINHTCLTIEATRARGIDVLGVIMMGQPDASNKAAIEHYANTQVLAEIPYFTQLNEQALTNLPMPTPCLDALERCFVQ